MGTAVGIGAGVDAGCGDTGAGVGCDGVASLDIGVDVGKIEGVDSQCATAHSPHSSNPETSSFILRGTCCVRMKSWILY